MGLNKLLEHGLQSSVLLSLATIYTANGSPMHVSHLGNVSTPALSISNVYQILKLTHNLLSIGQLTELGFSLTFSSTDVVMQNS